MFPCYMSNEVNLQVHRVTEGQHHAILYFEDNNSSPIVQDEVQRYAIQYCYGVQVLWVKRPLTQEALFDHMRRYGDMIARLHHYTVRFKDVNSFHDLEKAGFVISQSLPTG